MLDYTTVILIIAVNINNIVSVNDRSSIHRESEIIKACHPVQDCRPVGGGEGRRSRYHQLQGNIKVHR